VKKLSIIGVAALVTTLSFTGCSDDGDTTNVTNVQGDVTVDAFPGGSIQANNLADDMRAFSENNTAVNAVITRFNGTSGTAVVLFTTNDNNSGNTTLWASYYNGSTLTRPTPLTAADVDYTQGVVNLFETSVVFINSSGNTTTNVANRNGDAIILYKRPDLDNDGAGTADARQVALFTSYFDLSSLTFDGNGNGRRVDNQETGTVQDIAGEDVSRIGLLSDSNKGRAFHTGDAAVIPPNVSALSTSFCIATWIQADLGTNDVGTPPDDSRMFFRTFNLQSSTNPPSLLTQAEVPLPTGSLELQAAQVRNATTIVSGGFVTVNSALIFQQNDNGAALDRTMSILRVVSANSNTASPFEAAANALTPGAAGLGVPDTEDATSEFHMDTFHPNGLYGPNDVSNGRFTLFFIAGSNAIGDMVDAFVAEVSTDTTVPFVPATDRVQISANIGVEGLDFTDFNTNSANFPGLTGANKRKERLSQDKTYFAVAYREGAPINPGTGTPGNQNCDLMVATLGTGTGALSTRLSTALQVSSGANNVSGWQWQDELDGERIQTVKALGNQTDCPHQSNTAQMALVYEESTGTNDQVFVRTFANTGGNAAPSTVGSAVSLSGGNGVVFENGEMTGVYNGTGNRRLPKSVFLVDNGTTSSGAQRYVAFYVRDNDNTAGNTDNHLYAMQINAGVAGTVVQIDSGDSARDVMPTGVRVQTVGSQASTTAFAGSLVNVIFSEQRINSTSSTTLRARIFDKNLRNSNANIAFGNEFKPAVGTSPTRIDNDTAGSSTVLDVRYSGNTLAVYFTQNANLQYVENNGSTWGDVQLIDNRDEPPTPAFFIANGSSTDANCNNLSGTLTFFMKQIPFQGSNRLMVRRRN
jgi:hypothetical protein